MDGFDGQLRARQNNDEALLEHAFANISDAVFGSKRDCESKANAKLAAHKGVAGRRLGRRF